MTAWAILFHCETATALWATTTNTTIAAATVDDPLAVSAETVLGFLDFAGIGADNIPEFIDRLAVLRDMRAVDAAAMLAQTQRADAINAVIKLATSPAGRSSTVSVMRHMGRRGRPVDYRTDPAEIARQGYPLVSQRVMLRLLLVEQLRGVRGLEAAALVAAVPREADLEMGKVGQQCSGRMGPMCAEDEVVLISELANDDPAKIFRRNHVAAVKNLGKCRHFVAEAMAVAQSYADRKPRRDKRGRTRRDPLKEAGKEALRQLKTAVAAGKAP